MAPISSGFAVLPDKRIKHGLHRAIRRCKTIEMGLVRVAQAIAEGKVKVTVADLDRLIRLEEFLREEDKKAGGLTVILDWTDASGNVIRNRSKTDE